MDSLRLFNQFATLPYDLSIGVLANFLTILLAILIKIVSRFLNQRQLGFFGIQKNRRFDVYYGCISAGTQLVGADESQEAIRFSELFHYHIPGLGDGDSILSKVFLAGVKVRGIASSPTTPLSFEVSFLTLGSPMHTFASRLFEQKLEPRIFFKDGAMHFPGGDVVQDQNQAFLLKKCRNGFAYFYAAGLTESGTLAASKYLADHWKELDKKYPTPQSFFVRIRFSDQQKVEIISEGNLTDLD